MPFFYYVKVISTQTLSPRKSNEWPPVGGEVNDVVWKIEIDEKTAKRKFASLDLKFRNRALRDLTQ